MAENEAPLVALQDKSDKMESKKDEINKTTAEYRTYQSFLQGLKVQMGAFTLYVVDLHQRIMDLQSELSSLQNTPLPLPPGHSKFFLASQYNLDQQELEELKQQWEGLKNSLGFRF